MKSFWNKKSVFLTGATGFIGTWLTLRLLEMGAKVIILYFPDEKQSQILQSPVADNIVKVEGDLRDFYCLEKIFLNNKIDIVFHLGAQTQVGQALKNPLETYETNIRGTYHLLEVCRLSKKTFDAIIIASSDKAYGDHEVFPFVEETPLKPRYPYDVSKACTELIALSYYHTYHMPVVVTRCGNVYGGGDFNWDRLIPSVIKSLFYDESPVLRSDGKSLRDYLFVEDVVQAYLQIGFYIKEKKIYGEVFNLSPNEPKPVLDVVYLIRKIMGKENIQPIILNEAKGEIQHQYLTSKKAEQIFGWKPLFSFSQGIEITIEWYQMFLQESEIKTNALFSHRS